MKSNLIAITTHQNKSINHILTKDITMIREGFPGPIRDKETAYQCKRGKRRRFDPWVRRSPGEGNGNPLQPSCLEKSHGQKSLAGYSPWGHEESDATETI